MAHDWEIQVDKVSLKGKGFLPAGNKTAWTMVYSDINKDSCLFQMIDLTVDGTKVPGGTTWPSYAALKCAKHK